MAARAGWCGGDGAGRFRCAVSASGKGVGGRHGSGATSRACPCERRGTAPDLPRLHRARAPGAARGPGQHAVAQRRAMGQLSARRCGASDVTGLQLATALAQRRCVCCSRRPKHAGSGEEAEQTTRRPTQSQAICAQKSEASCSDAAVQSSPRGAGCGHGRKRTRTGATSTARVARCYGSHHPELCAVGGRAWP